MWRALLAKDLRRAWRNPMPWLLNLALPLAITAVVGMVFGGGRGGSNRLGRIKFAVVDQDQGLFTRFLRGASGQEKTAQYFDPVFLEQDEAMRQLNHGDLSAALIIPAHFTSNYLTGGKVEWDLVKNPAEQIHPAVLEELLGVATTGMNAISRNFTSEFPKWRRLADDRADYHEIAQLIDDTGNRVQALKKYLDPPLIGWTNLSGESTPADSAKSDPPKSAPAFNLFGYMLPGMAGLFLLLLANQAMRDLHEELALRTFERYNTIRQGLMPFIGSKALFGFVIVATGAAILLGGGAAMFRIDWPRPAPLAGLTLAYAGFATGLMSIMVALAPDTRRANAFNSIISMVLGMAGGCMFPPDQLPAAMRELVTKHLPTFWYSQGARDLWWSDASWTMAAIKLLAVGALCLGISAWLFRRRFREGIKT